MLSAAARLRRPWQSLRRVLGTYRNQRILAPHLHLSRRSTTLIFFASSSGLPSLSFADVGVHGSVSPDDFLRMARGNAEESPWFGVVFGSVSAEDWPRPRGLSLERPEGSASSIQGDGEGGGDREGDGEGEGEEDRTGEVILVPRLSLPPLRPARSLEDPWVRLRVRTAEVIQRASLIGFLAGLLVRGPVGASVLSRWTAQLVLGLALLASTTVLALPSLRSLVLEVARDAGLTSRHRRLEVGEARTDVWARALRSLAAVLGDGSEDAGRARGSGSGSGSGAGGGGAGDDVRHRRERMAPSDAVAKGSEAMTASFAPVSYSDTTSAVGSRTDGGRAGSQAARAWTALALWLAQWLDRMSGFPTPLPSSPLAGATRGSRARL